VQVEITAGNYVPVVTRAGNYVPVVTTAGNYVPVVATAGNYVPVVTTHRTINVRNGGPLWVSHSGSHIAWGKS